MAIAITAHAAARIQQRIITVEAIEWLLDFGTSMRCRGADNFFFDKKARRRLAAVLDGADLRRAEKYLNAYAVVADDGCVITTARRTRRLRRV